MSTPLRLALPLVVLLVVGCGAPSQPGAPPVTHSPTPQATVTMYFVGDTPRGFRLFPEEHLVPALSGDPVLDALRALLDGNEAPLDPDHVSLWARSGTTVRSAEHEGVTLRLDLAYGRLNVGAEAEMRAIDQLLWTAAAADPSIRRLRITVDDRPIESLAGHVDATRAFVLGPASDVLSDVVVTSPQEGDAVEGAVVVSGEACTFEANVAWELRRDGEVVDGGATTAAAACPERSPWSVDLGLLASGDYEFRASEFSAMDGSLVAEDTRRFVVGSSG